MERKSGIMRRIEGREEPQQMTDIINRYATNGQHVMGIVASLNIDATLHLVVGLYTWQHLSIVQGVGIAHNLWHIIHHLHVPYKGSVSTIPHCTGVGIAFDNNGIKRQIPHFPRFLGKQGNGESAEY